MDLDMSVFVYTKLDAITLINEEKQNDLTIIDNGNQFLNII
jgi:hypothetical protein